MATHAIPNRSNLAQLYQRGFSFIVACAVIAFTTTATIAQEAKLTPVSYTHLTLPTNREV